MTATAEERDVLVDRIYRLETALAWIRFHAALHYIGGAFEPEHMRGLANLAADALADTFNEPLPDFDEAMSHAKEEGARLAAELAAFADADEVSAGPPKPPDAAPRAGDPPRPG